MAFRVAGRGNREKVRPDRQRPVPDPRLFNAEARASVGRTEIPLASEPLRELLVVGDVVPVSQEERRDPARLFETSDERRREPRGIDEHVAAFGSGTPD